MRAFNYGFVAVLAVVVSSQGVSAEQYPQATRQAVYDAHARRYVADRTRRVTPRVNPSSQRLVYVDRTTRYGGNVYSGYRNRAQARVIHGRDYVAPATVTYVVADTNNEPYSQVVDGVDDRIVVIEQNDDSRRYAGYARYKNARSYSGHSRGYGSSGYSRAYYPQQVYQPVYHRPAYVSYGYAFGGGYGHCDSYGYGVYRHGYGHHYGHRRHGSYGHYGYHRGGHRSHSGVSFHFRF